MYLEIRRGRTRIKRGKNMKIRRFAAAAMAALMTVSMSFTAFAAEVVYRDETGNGYTEYYDDGSIVDYNARGDVFTFYDADGNETRIDGDGDGAVSSYSSSSSSRSKSTSTKYEDAYIKSASWDYSNGRCMARWSATYQSKGKYTVTLYRDGRKVTSKSSSGGSSINFTDAIANANKTGDYYFTVKGKWSGGYTDTRESGDLDVNSSRLSTIRNRTGSNSSSGSGSSTAANPTSGPTATNYGWIWNNNFWQYRRSNGSLATNCWELINGKWYSFDNNGIMRANQWIRNTSNEHIWYYVGSDGAMVTNTNVQGYNINANGECWY